MKKKDGSAFSVLLAEDKEIAQILAMNIFIQLGCEVDLAKNGEEVIDRHTVNQYDIIFMDCDMPLMDGYQATKNIRSTEHSRSSLIHTPIIALTGKVMANDKQRCLEAGMDDYITKPIRIEHAADMIEKYCVNRIDYTNQW